MLILVEQLSPISLKLQFNEDELNHPLFQITLNKMYGIDNFDVSANNTSIDIEVEQMQSSYDVVGQTVDDIRELWCGDVIFQYDNQGNPLPKDLSECPCFIIGEARSG